MWCGAGWRGVGRCGMAWRGAVWDALQAVWIPTPLNNLSHCACCALLCLQGVTPDIVTMAKGIGNGLPLAAVVTTPEIAATLATRLHFNTFGE